MRPALLLVFLCVGCKMPDDDPLAVGRFEVQATRTESCGDAVVLASPTFATFSVYLRKTSDTILLWDDGHKRWPLARDSDGTFVASTKVVMTMGTSDEPVVEEDLWDPDPEPEPEGASCVMQRIDALAVDLFEDAFEGTLLHTFGVQDGSDCGAIAAGPPPLADTLPCTVAYDLAASRLP